MRKSILILVMAVLLIPAFAQVSVTKTIKKVNSDVELMQEFMASPVYFGVYVEDISPAKAREMEYPNNHGILITGVVEGSPAWESGLQANDILTSLDGVRIDNRDVFDEIRSEMEAGDEVEIGYWRAGYEYYMEMTMRSRDDVAMDIDIEAEYDRPGFRFGTGGMFYIPMWFTPDLDDVNILVDRLGFDQFGEDGLFMQGFAMKMGVGRGFLLGGSVVSYKDSYTKSNAEDPSFHDWFSYSNTFGGITLDKSIPITKGLAASLGVLMGWGGHTIELFHSNADYTWPDAGNGFTTGNYQAEIRRSYLVAQPKAELVYNIIPTWLSIRAEVGYAYGYSTKEGWRVKGNGDDSFAVANSPNTPYQGLTLSIGPWIGF